jgi:hypothetical protein
VVCRSSGTPAVTDHPTSRIKSRIVNMLRLRFLAAACVNATRSFRVARSPPSAWLKKAAVWHRELRFDHLPDQLVFIVQELHHFQRGWGGLIARRFCHAHPLAAQEQQAPNTGQHYGGQQPSYYGPIPRHCYPSTFQTID